MRRGASAAGIMLAIEFAKNPDNVGKARCVSGFAGNEFVVWSPDLVVVVVVHEQVDQVFQSHIGLHGRRLIGSILLTDESRCPNNFLNSRLVSSRATKSRSATRVRIHRNDASLPRIAPGMEKLTLILIIIGVALILTTCLTVLFG